MVVDSDQSRVLNKERLEKGVKLVLLGEMNTGKTSIVNRLVKNTFLDHVESTIGYFFLQVDSLNIS